VLLSFDDLWERLNANDESTDIEAKLGRQMGDSVLETVSAFSNEPGLNGGYVVFGIKQAEEASADRYQIVGVADPDRLQNEMSTRCNTEFNYPVRPILWVHQHRGLRVVIAFVPEAAPHLKPVYIKKHGLRGAYRRCGSGDIVCSDSDIERFYQERMHRSYDKTPLPDAAMEDFDPEVIAVYRKLRSEIAPSAPELQFPDEELLYALNAAVRRGSSLAPTMAGILIFGKRSAIRRHFPLLRIDYIRLEGREWVRDPENRGEHVEIMDPLLRAIPRIISQIIEDLPRAFRLPRDQDLRQEVPLLPRRALEELVVNSVMHRDYRTRGAIQIIRYSNRVEFRNPGISLVADDRLGEPGSVTRNEAIAGILHDTPYAETKGTGIRAVRELVREHHLDPPVFESDREKDTFKVTVLFRHLLDSEAVAWLDNFQALRLASEDQKALLIVREVGAIHNAAYRDINRVDTLTASRHLQRLRDLELLELKGQGQAAYYLPGPRLRRFLEGESDTVLTPVAANATGIPTALKEEIDRLGLKCPARQISALTLRVCSIRPMMVSELGRLFKRTPEHMRRRYLSPLVREKKLELTVPGSPRHPEQAYRTVLPVVSTPRMEGAG